MTTRRNPRRSSRLSVAEESKANQIKLLADYKARNVASLEQAEITRRKKARKTQSQNVKEEHSSDGDKHLRLQNDKDHTLEIGSEGKESDEKLPSKTQARRKEAKPAALKIEKQLTDTSKDPDAKEVERLKSMLLYERSILDEERQRLEASGCSDVEAQMQKISIIGVDEVGVGPLAGPIVSCAIVLPVQTSSTAYGLQLWPGINDSKKLKPSQRQDLARSLQSHSIGHALGIVSSQEVDSLNPRQASMEAMRRAVVNLMDQIPHLQQHRIHLLVDYHTVPNLSPDRIIKQTCLEKGDAKSQSIAAASIVAKVFRDDYMAKLHESHPQFGFNRNAGYGTKEHLAALRDGYMCPEHRLSFAPVRAAHLKTQSENESPHNALQGGHAHPAIKADAFEEPPTKRRRRSAKPVITIEAPEKFTPRAAPNKGLLDPSIPVEPERHNDQISKEETDTVAETPDHTPFLQRITSWFPSLARSNHNANMF